MKKKVFQLLVDNTSGVLSRISGLFSRRGYNIESITAGTTADPRITRITIVASGDDEILAQIEKQVAKLEDVRDVKELKPESSVYRELALIKVKVSAKERQGVIAVADIFRANIIDVSAEGLIIELTGNQDKVDAFLSLLEGYEILKQIEKQVAKLEDVRDVKELKPDVAFISNHGGRVENRIGSTAEFLYEHSKKLKNYCGELWVDGGIRTKQDEQVAKFLGANQVLIGRPVISALCEKHV